MTKKNRIAALAATGMVASLVVGSLVIGSNMGFKKNQSLTLANQEQWIAVPYTGPYTNAGDLIDLVLNGSGRITEFVPGTPPTVVFWDGSFGTNFAFKPGHAYQFRPGAAAGTSSIIVGAHDPNAVVPLGGFSGGLDYLISPPYHTTATNAQGLIDEIVGGATVTRLAPGVPPAFDFWTGGFGTNFPYTIGEGIQFRPVLSSAGFTPSHF